MKLRKKKKRVVEIKNLSITCYEDFDDTSIERVLKMACKDISLDASFIYLVKISIGDLRPEQANRVLQHIKNDFLSKGIDNCIFVPICKSGIQDITMDSIEVIHV